MVRILGVSASLRNARCGVSDDVCADLRTLSTRAELKTYLQRQVGIRLKDFFDHGRQAGLPFDQLYRNLRAAHRQQGMSNSEAALAAGLWGACQKGAEIAHCGLAKYFPASGVRRNIDELCEAVLQADALLLSGPVYFGDRGSLAQEFIELLRDIPELRAHLRDRLYGGIAVGAKRNGGQETTLIYQMVDMTNLNMLCVGNDSETTSQYGGTVHAGDIGAMAEDDYGIATSVGTGRRLAEVAAMMTAPARMADKVRIAVWMLQDRADSRGVETVQALCAEVEAQVPQVRFQIHDVTKEFVYPCIACDVCPVSIGADEEYRCIITTRDDFFCRHHAELIDTDAVLLAAYSPIDKSQVRSVYQRFIERTRYLRRDDYILGDMLCAPLVVSEVDSNQNLHIRMMTSLVRHGTVLHHPLIGFELDGRVVNLDRLLAQAVSFARNAVRLTAGRLHGAMSVDMKSYNPVGYSVSAEKLKEDISQGKVENRQRLRQERLAQEQSRLEQ